MANVQISDRDTLTITRKYIAGECPTDQSNQLGAALEMMIFGDERIIGGAVE